MEFFQNISIVLEPDAYAIAIVGTVIAIINSFHKK